MKNNRLLAFLFSILRGALIGTGAILPGISGGVLCVVLGVYKPMMALMANPLREIKARWRYFAPILLGFAVGVLALSRLVDWLFRASPVPAVWLFIGLIAGTMPALWREAGEKGRKPVHILTSALTLVIVLAALLLLGRAGSLQMPRSTLTWLLCGALWGVGFIVPGLSPSSLFILMDVYQPMAAGIADLSLPILLPMGAGLLACVLLLSRAVTALLARRYAVTMHVILGVAAASTLAILPLGEPFVLMQAILYAACFALGFLIAFWMERVNAHLQSQGEKA